MPFLLRNFLEFDSTLQVLLPVTSPRTSYFMQFLEFFNSHIVTRFSTGPPIRASTRTCKGSFGFRAKKCRETWTRLSISTAINICSMADPVVAYERKKKLS